MKRHNNSVMFSSYLLSAKEQNSFYRLSTLEYWMDWFVVLWIVEVTLKDIRNGRDGMPLQIDEINRSLLLSFYYLTLFKKAGKHHHRNIPSTFIVLKECKCRKSIMIRVAPCGIRDHDIHGNNIWLDRGDVVKKVLIDVWAKYDLKTGTLKRLGKQLMVAAVIFNDKYFRMTLFKHISHDTPF